MNSGDAVGLVGLVVILAAGVLVVLWVLVPFMLWACVSRLKLIHDEQKHAAKWIVAAINATHSAPAPEQPPAPRAHMYRVTGKADGVRSSITIKAEDEASAIAIAKQRGIRVQAVAQV